MKKLLLIAGAAVTVAGAGVAVASHYDTYQTNKQKQEAKVVAVTADIEKQRQDQLKAHEADWVAKYDKLRAECEKGRTAYDKLTALAKAQVKAPVCTQVVPQ